MQSFADNVVIDRDFLRSVFHSMLRARILENKLSSLYKAGKIVGGVYLGRRTVDSFHRELGMTMWDKCGMARSREGLTEALGKIPQIREEFWTNVKIPGSGENVNMELEKAGRVADFLEFAEVMCYDARDREESCGGHFRSEHQFFETDPEVIAGSTQPGEAKRDDAHFSHVSAWQYNGNGCAPTLHKEPLVFEDVHVSIRSYA